MQIQVNKILNYLFDKIKENKWIVVVTFLFIFILISLLFSGLYIPNSMTIATGDINGTYHKAGLIYKEELAKKGIEVTLLNSQGSVDNLNLLKEKKVDMAFIQNNLISKDQTPDYLKGVASLYNEPIFVFYRKALNIKLLSEIKEKKVSVGKKGSGTYFISTKLLEINDISENQIKPEYLSYLDSAKELLAGKIDVAFMVTSFDNNVIKELISNKDIGLLSFDNYKAYKYHSVNLSTLSLPQGYYDIGKNIPAKEITLLTTLATLVCQKDLHPRIIESLLIIIKEITQKDYDKTLSLENKDFKFPSDKFIDFPMHSASELYFRDGPSFLTRYFSYGAALFISRLKYFLLPLIPFIVLFARVIPSVYNFRLGLIMKKKYKELGEIEKLVVKTDSKKELENLQKRINELKNDMDITSEKIPAQYQRNIYDWKMHISLIEDAVENKLKSVSI